jgi:hypothetical protein
LPQGIPVPCGRRQFARQIFYGFLSLHKITVSPTPNQPSKGKLFLGMFSYLFSPVVL